MTSNFSFRLPVVFCLLLLTFCADLALSQAKFYLPIYVKDAGNKRDTLLFGIHPSATYCIDGPAKLGFSACDSLVEIESPPKPPTGNFDARWVDLTTRSFPCLGEGSEVNMRNSSSSAQIDTFLISYQPGVGGFPFTFKWPAGGVLGNYYDSLMIKDNVIGILAFADMKRRDSLVVTNSSISQLAIYGYRPKTPPVIPPVPIQTFPDTNAVDQDTSLTFTWGASAGAAQYVFQLSTSPSFATYIRRDTLTTTSRLVGGLIPAQTYYWRVAANNVFSRGCFSSRQFVVKSFGPPVPTLTLPADLATVSTTPTLNWSSSTGATSYYLQVASDAGFAAVVFGDSTLTSTSQLLGAQPNCSNRYWRVRAKNAVGTSAWSLTRSFSVTDATPGLPILSGPADNATNVSLTPTLSWAGADICSRTYTLRVARDTGFTQIVRTYTLSATSRVVDLLEEDTDFYWSVSASSNSGTSAYSSYRHFKTLLNLPRTPILVSPLQADTSVPILATLRWNTIVHTDSYHVQLSGSNTFSTTIVDANTTDTTIQVSGLTNCTQYYWRVRGRNVTGFGSYSTIRNFKVATAIPAPPALSIPLDGKDSVDEVTSLSWGTDICASRYHVQLTLDTSGLPIVVEFEDTLSGTTTSVGPLNSATTYFWRVRSVNYLGAGSFSAWRRFRITPFTTPPVPVLGSPANSAINLPLPITVCWDSSRRALAYRIQVAVDTGFTTLIFNDTSRSLCKTLTILQNSRTYYWRVLASNSVGNSEYSPRRMFTTLSPPGTATLIDPANGETGVVAQPQFVWSIPDLVDVYHFQLARDSAFTSIVKDDTTLLVNSTQAGPLESYRKYYWRVRGKNSAGWGNFSPTGWFQTNYIGVSNWVMPLAVSETGPARDTIYFGLHPNATQGIDAGVGEFELPPPDPPGYFFARFISTPNRPTLLGEGLRLNLLRFVNYTQIDTFRVKFQTGLGTHPVTVSWSKQFVNQVCDSMVIKDEFGGSFARSRMDLDSVLIVTDPSITTLLIIKYGAHPILAVYPVPPGNMPKGFALSQNYPNPFNPTTRIRFSTEHVAEVRLMVYDVLGREVSRLADGTYFPGEFIAEWNGRNSDGSPMPSGIYYVQMIARAISSTEDGADQFSVTRKMVMLK